MAAFPGWVVGSAAGGHKNPHLSDALGQMDAGELWPPSANAATVYAPGAVVNALPVGQPAAGAESGSRAYSFLRDYYFRVHIVPDSIHFGALIAFAERTTEVWSAFFVSNLLSSIDAVGDDGVTLVEPIPAPTTFEPLESRVYTVQADATGPATLAATYTYDFASGFSVLTVTGDRIVPFPFPPDWTFPPVERLEWGTSLLSSHSAKERRAATRNGARFGFEYTLRTGTDRERVTLENLLHGWHSRVFAVPLWFQPEALQSDLLPGSTTIATETETSGYTVGGIAALVDGLTVEVAEVVTVAPGLLTIARGTNRLFPRGSRIMPARFVRLGIPTGIEYLSDAVISVPVRFTGVYEEEIPAAAETATYQGYPVFVHRRDWGLDADAEYSRYVFETDYGTGLTTRDDRAGVSSVSRAHGWTLDGRQATHDYRAWLAARGGRLVPFWQPSGQSDILVLSTLGGTSTAFLAENRGHARLIGAQVERRDMMIELHDGTRYYRRITSAVEVDPDTEQISFNVALGQTVAPSDIRHVSYMALSRLTADAVEVAHVTDTVAQVQARVSVVRDDVP